MNASVVWLNKGSNYKASLIGNKAFNLQTLNNNDFSIPKSFCITTAALDSPNFWLSLEQAYKNLINKSINKKVALRSSTLVEDLENKSHAGLFDSFLNIESYSKLKEKAEEQLSKFKSSKQLAAFLVQEMIPADYSGVLFSKNPLNGLPEIVIEATEGLADKLLSGQVNPLQVKICEGKIEKNITRVSNEQLQALAKEAERITKIFAGDQDIEWAIYKNKVNIIQTRPITTLGNAVWSRQPLDERFPDVLKPLDWSHQIDWQLENAYRKLLKSLSIKNTSPELFSVNDGYLYINLADLKKLPVANVVEIIAHNKADIVLNNRLKALFLGIRIFFIALTRARKWKKQLASYKQQLPAKNTDIKKRLIQLKKASLTISKYHLQTIFLIQILYSLLTKVGAKEQFCKKRSNKAIETKQDLLLLVQKLRSNSKINTLLNSNLESSQILNEVKKDFTANNAFENFLARNGHRANFYYLSSPRWDEKPAYIIDMVRSLFLEEKQNIKAGEQQNLVQRLILRVYYKFVDIREDENYYMLHNNYLFKQLLKKQASVWKDGKLINEANDIYYLTIKEIEQEVLGKANVLLLHDLVTSRKSSLHSSARTLERPSLGEKTFGIPVSAGKISGKAVVFNGKISKVSQSNIIVAKSLNSSMLSLLKQAGGIVTEYGGMLSHGAILCRELSVPAVSKVTNATTSIKDGQMITVDAYKGEVIRC